MVADLNSVSDITLDFIKQIPNPNNSSFGGPKTIYGPNGSSKTGQEKITIESTMEDVYNAFPHRKTDLEQMFKDFPNSRNMKFKETNNVHTKENIPND